ncbi:related to RNA-binding protein La1 [Cephalotrichum gorgonifer]|uniref:Related to RNA-binding protein La1 n=1 Tax=Cephalotrichum gorgonifer TaxID=2041049 RepID=A0AAE8MR27_9PEZI|nr:related to RNA-binding protein La1 [Cephalotrichum gorgonifer]
MSEEVKTAAPVEAAAPAAEVAATTTTTQEAEATPAAAAVTTEAVPAAATTEGSKTFAKNVKSDPNELPVTDDPALIRGQVEYYFGDSNLPRDKFMWESTGGEENKPVSLKTICSFKRMRRFQPYESVVAALRESNELDISGEEGKEELKRKRPYKSSSERKKKQEAATLYVKGFGEEVATTQFDIEAFFAQHGPVNYIKLRRSPEKVFKGSVFVEFPDEEAAKKFAEDAPKWKDQELKIMTKHDYCEEKSQLIREGKLQPSSSSRPFFEGRGDASRGRGGGRGGFNKGANFQKKGQDGRDGGFRGRGRGGRGGRGRGRGRGGRDGGRDERKEAKDQEAPKPHNANDVKPRINVSEAPKTAESNGKRAREDDGGAGQPPAKKVDVATS